jgi:hypothetical protein
MSFKNAFSEQDKNDLVGFLNFMYKHAEWKFNSEQSFELGKHVMKVNALIKKIDDHVLEVLSVKDAPEPIKKAK